jgi:hypothetical protein
MWNLLAGVGVTLGMIALSIVVPLFVGFVVLWIVSYIPLVGRRGRTHRRTLREGVASEYAALPDRTHRSNCSSSSSDCNNAETMM